MNIIFVSTVCSRGTYEDICKKRSRPSLDSSQKFFEMFLSGLAKQPDVQVDAVSVRPISHSTYPERHIPASSETDGNVTYHYVPVVNLPVVRSLFAERAVRKTLKKLLKQHRGEENVIICDPLLLEGLLPTVKLGKKYGATTVGFLTDMPSYANDGDGHGKFKAFLYRIYEKKTDKALPRLDKHIVLTEAMRCVAEDKPWLLLDCFVDEGMLKNVSPTKYTDGLPHVLYAGKLHSEFGLDLLADAMPLVKTPCVFDIYGDGNYADALRKLSETHPSIRVHGIVPLKEVLGHELGASLLINPRTSAGEFTKYSFPSKTAEYMQTGVPVVMFRLPGISEEYASYLNYPPAETAEALAAVIDEVLSRPEDRRNADGAKAKEFITATRNNLAQAERVIDFIKNEGTEKKA